MLTVGLTGGIGAGKSTVAARLTALGATVVDADRLAREAVEPGTPGLAAVVEAFGVGVLGRDGGLDRPALGRVVFADQAARLRLNGVLHPRIAALTAERMAAMPPDAVVVHDVPLLVETGMGARYHLVLVVHAPEQVRVRRLVSERGLTEPEADARVAAQADDEARWRAADVWLDNSGAPGSLDGPVDELWGQRLLPFEWNVRSRRGAPRPAQVVLAAPDPDWPAQAARLAARVARAAGPSAVRVDHHGSTAVPGLAAKDLIDLQLVVPDLATADTVGRALDDAGFERAEGRWWDSRPDGSTAEKRVHTAADPGRPVNLHVRPADGPAWREMLVFRDWLRVHGDERAAYASVKRSSQGVGSQDYLAAKGPWITAALDRAQAWADACGWSPGEPLATG
jgi:dephospho-CoA kinase